MKPSTEQKADDKAFEQAINHCMVALATKSMTSFEEVCDYLGLPSSSIAYPYGPLTVLDFKHKVVPLLKNYRKTKMVQRETILPTPSPIPLIQSAPTPTIEDVKSVYDKHPLDSLNWLPPLNPKQKAKLYPFQTKAAKDIIYRLVIEDKRGLYLRASVGVGKTFIFGQALRWLYDTNFFETCMSPWPVLIVTKASIVEQTRRVMADDFGLDTVRQVSVINYDALRSSQGLDTMLEKGYKVVGGERYPVFKWRPFMHPRLFIVDEAQAAKNEDSQQSEIINAIASIVEQPPIVRVKVIFSSATPFTKVSEAKYACVNMGIPYRII